MTYSIRVMNSDGTPAADKTVSVHYHGIIGSHDSGFTDSDGWVSLWVDSDGLVITDIYVDGDAVSGDGQVYPGDTLSVSV